MAAGLTMLVLIAQMVAVSQGQSSDDPCEGYCLYGGECVKSSDVPYCKCPVGRRGPRCQYAVESSKPGECPNVSNDTMGTCNVVCNSDSDCSGTLKCCPSPCGMQCQQGIVRDPCYSFCQNGGVCRLGVDIPSCKCPTGYSGYRCEYKVSRRLARSSGACPVIEKGTVGTCIDGCQSDENCGAGEKCCSNGCGRECIRVNFDPCFGFKCENGGYCTAPADAPYCVCPAGFTGKNCENRIIHRNPCITFTCENGGTCTSPADIPYCLCPPGFSGMHCETTLPAKPGSCPKPLGVGICIYACDNDHSCEGDKKCCSNGCGRDCLSPDYCDGYCLNGAECIKSVSAPYCKCAAGYTGRRCETKLETGRPGKCPAVEEGTVGACVEMCSSDTDCDEGEKCCSNGCGHQCRGIVTDPCYQYCQNGATCRPGVYVPTCTCPSGYSGAKCEITNQTQHPGTCPFKEYRPQYADCCKPLCSSDDNCPADQKCCPSSCGGGACINAENPPSEITCASILCAPGTFCREVAYCPYCETKSFCLSNEAFEKDYFCVEGTPCPPGMFCAQWVRTYCMPKVCFNCSSSEICKENASGAPVCVSSTIELGSCPKVTRTLPRSSSICKLERRVLVKCKSDKDCKKQNERCCTSNCGNKTCVAVEPKLIA